MKAYSRVQILGTIATLSVFFISFLAYSSDEASTPSTPLMASREPFVAGSFYPSDAGELGQMIDGFLQKAPAAEKKLSDTALLIVPHAGYIYSGQTAAYGYKLLEGTRWDSVVLVGPYHKTSFKGAAVWTKGDWKTPLGTVPIDTALAEAIQKEDESFGFTQAVHLTEHSLEAQIPFLQKVLGSFRIVPILINNPSLDNCERLAKAIVKNIEGKKVLIIISTDMSHYYPDAVARPMDSLALDLTQKGDPKALLEALSSGKSEFCGSAAVFTALEIRKLWGSPPLRLLHYSNSGDATGDKNKVVGYGTLVMLKESENNFSLEERRELLGIARRTIEQITKGEQPAEVEATDPQLRAPKAAFVTLNKKGRLRGCIGTFSAKKPLYLVVRDMAIEAATHDPRFEPVSAQELKDLEIEISVLEEPLRVPGAEEIEMGKHGVIVRRDGHSGVFLPKVAADTRWTKEEFLNELCTQKAGLETGCWKDKDTELYVFTAEDFGDAPIQTA